MQIKQEYGLHNEKLIHISETESKITYLCPCCNSELVAKKGKIKIHHFAHKNLNDCGGALETSLHIMAKEILSKSNTMVLPINFKSNSLFDYRIETNKPGFSELIYDSVAIEKRVDDIIPDLILYSNGFPLLVEIKVTHGIDEVKLEKIAKINIPLIEITIDYKNNDSQIKEMLESSILNSRFLKSTIRSPEDCLNRINIIDKMEKFILNFNLNNQTITLPTKKYLTFNQQTYMEDGYPPEFAFLIANNTDVLIDDFKIIGKDYTSEEVYIEMTIGSKNLLSIFCFNNKTLRLCEVRSITEERKKYLNKNELICNEYNSIFVIKCNGLDLIQIVELLKSQFNNDDKYFIKNKQIDILKTQIFEQVEKYVTTQSVIKKFGFGHLYRQQIDGLNCPKNSRRANLKTCQNCNSLIKQCGWTRTPVIACGELLSLKQSFVSNVDKHLIDFHHEFDVDIGF